MNCPICNEKMNEYLSDFKVCKTCEVIVRNPEHYYDEGKEFKHYDKHINTLENEGYVKMFEDFIDFISLHVKSFDTVLDFGSGKGAVFSQVLTNKGKQVTCYDKFFHDDPSYKKKRYDLITSTEVFEHLSDPKSILEELKELLNEGGHIALMTNFHPQNKEDFAKWWYQRDPTHIAFFIPKSFEVLANKCGLRVKGYDDKKSIILTKEKR